MLDLIQMRLPLAVAGLDQSPLGRAAFRFLQSRQPAPQDRIYRRLVGCTPHVVLVFLGLHSIRDKYGIPFL